MKFTLLFGTQDSACNSFKLVYILVTDKNYACNCGRCQVNSKILPVVCNTSAHPIMHLSKDRWSSTNVDIYGMYISRCDAFHFV